MTHSRHVAGAVGILGLLASLAAALVLGDWWLASGLVITTLLASGLVGAGPPPRVGRIRIDLWLAWVALGSAALLATYLVTGSEAAQLAVLVALAVVARQALPKATDGIRAERDPELGRGPRWQRHLPWLGVLVFAWLGSYLWQLLGDSGEYMSMFLCLIVPAVWVVATYEAPATHRERTAATPGR